MRKLGWFALNSAVMLLLLAACNSENSPEFRQKVMDLPDCESHRGELAEFVLGCVENGNPMSDEEGEDLVKQCERTGIKVVCPEVRFNVTIRCGSYCEEVTRDKVTQ